MSDLPEMLTLAPKKKPKPLPEGLPSVLSVDRTLLPGFIGRYVFDVADRQQCPPDFVAVAALCGLSAVLGNKLTICPKQFDNWQVVPNLWGAIIGRPSAMKSPSMKAALEPLHQMEKAGRESYRQSLKAHKAEFALAELDEKLGKQEAQKHLKAGNRDKALAAVSGPPILAAPTRPRLIVNDATVEKLGELLNENPTGLLQERDELAGWLSQLRGEDGQAARAFYLQCFDGSGSFVYDRIGRGTIEIEQTTLSLIGGIQPARLAPLVRGAVSGNDDDGLLQRLQLAVWPDDCHSWEWRDRAPNRQARAEYNQAFERLAAMEASETPYRFSPPAQKLFIEWMTELQTNARSGDNHPALESYLLKLPQTITALALIFELIEWHGSTVGEEATAMALDWADYLQSHAKRIYSLATDGNIIGAKLLLNRRHNLEPEFPARAVQRKGWAGLSSREEVEEALSVLVEYDHLIEAVDTDTGGRPGTFYSWNEG